MIKKNREYVENGTSGDASVRSKFSISTSDVKIELPGYTGSAIEGVNVVEMNIEEKTLYISGDWLNRRVLENNDYSFSLKHGNLVKNLKFVKLHRSSGNTKLVLADSVTANELMDFVGNTGLPSCIGKAIFSSLPQNSNVPNALSHSLKHEKTIDVSTDDHTVQFSWTNTNEVTKNVLRWRAVPRVKRNTNIVYAVNSAGQYNPLPTPSLKSEWGSGEAISLRGKLVSIDVLNGGSFDGVPLISASYPGAMGASLSVAMSGNSILSVNVVEGGTGYNGTPTFFFSGATVNVAPSFLTLLGIADVQVDSHGYDYITPPSLILQGGSGSGGSVSTSVSVSNDGMVDFVRVIDGGTGYLNRSPISLVGNASGYVNCTNGVITSVTVNDNGYGYTSAPVINVTGTGSGAILQSTVSLYSDWNYVEIDPAVHTYTLSGLNKYAEYEWQLYSSTNNKDDLNSFSDSLKFKFN